MVHVGKTGSVFAGNSPYAVAVVTFAGLQQLGQSLVICGVIISSSMATPNAL